MCECRASYGGSLDQQVENEGACDRTKDDFTTVYMKAFTRKSTIRPDYAVFQSEYPDILAGPFTEYVVLNSVTNPVHPYEDVHNCFERVSNTNIPLVQGISGLSIILLWICSWHRNKPTLEYEHGSTLVKMNPKMKRYLDKEPDHKVLVTDYNNRGRTVYQVDYCDLRDGFESKKSRDRQRVSLPHNWGEVPVTTQRASYRVPERLATWNLKPRAVHPPASVLDPNLKEREILQVTTGVSEYESRVGVLGDMIMKDQLHGTHQDGLECKKYEQMMQTQEH